MKVIISIWIFVFAFILVSCSDLISISSEIQDGEELADGTEIPFSLRQNSPNPFVGTTYIRFDVRRQIHMKLTIYTEDWRKVSTLLDKIQSMGSYQIMFDSKTQDGESLPSGDYYYVLEGEGISITRKMKLFK